MGLDLQKLTKSLHGLTELIKGARRAISLIRKYIRQSLI